MVRSKAAGLVFGLLLGGCAAAAAPEADIAVLDWSLVRHGPAVMLDGQVRNQTARNLRSVTVEAVFYGPGGAYLGSVLAEGGGGSLPPGATAAIRGTGVWAAGMDRSIMLFRDAAGRRLTASVPETTPEVASP